MRDAGLQVLRGGGEGPTCELCTLGLFLDGTRDEEVRDGIRAHMGTLAGRVTLCEAHREDVGTLGFRTGPILAEAGANRKLRRASAAAVRRAHRASLPRLRPAPPAAIPPDTESGEGGGGIVL